MTGKFETRLAELGVTLADAPAPAANYVPFVQVGDLVFVSGQISQDANGFITGKLGDRTRFLAAIGAAPKISPACILSCAIIKPSISPSRRDCSG